VVAGGSAKHENVSSYRLEPPLEKKWDFDIDAGVGYSAIAISDAVVFVNNLAGELISFDISTANKLGSYKSLGKEANSTPLIMGNSIILSFAGDRNSSLASYNVETGDVNWTINLGQLETSPVQKDGFVYVGSLQGYLYKVDAKSDSIYWKFDAKAEIHSTCAIDSNDVIFGADNGSLYCVDVADGKLVWETIARAPIVATPTIWGNKIFVGSYDSMFYCINIADGSVAWEKNMSTKILGGSAIYHNEDIVFGGVNGVLYSLKMSDGSLNWKFVSYATISSSPLVSGNNIYFSSYDFHLYCLDGKAGNELWNYEMEGKSKTSPVIWRDYLIVAADKVVYCFTKKTAVN
jgi:outer membrane protein assembly factor BamB